MPLIDDVNHFIDKFDEGYRSTSLKIGRFSNVAKRTIADLRQPQSQDIPIVVGGTLVPTGNPIHIGGNLSPSQIEQPPPPQAIIHNIRVPDETVKNQKTRELIVVGIGIAGIFALVNILSK